PAYLPSWPLLTLDNTLGGGQRSKRGGKMSEKNRCKILIESCDCMRAHVVIFANPHRKAALIFSLFALPARVPSPRPTSRAPPCCASGHSEIACARYRPTRRR